MCNNRHRCHLCKQLRTQPFTCRRNHNWIETVCPSIVTRSFLTLFLRRDLNRCYEEAYVIVVTEITYMPFCLFNVWPRKDE
ncbi:hypothetical protein KIN20_033291 [Parelaphostrongylus tenuis]|uniref:Uncharacterized protein n=1 Tax=Parelaphostrongylus tenuis TaxID=148309 RepID=A0AAD5R887_PARTN|nr:hypothetical protein KIN20_033291 [Parelaphostrongylus tenuis]